MNIIISANDFYANFYFIPIYSMHKFCKISEKVQFINAIFNFFKIFHLIMQYCYAKMKLLI